MAETMCNVQIPAGSDGALTVGKEFVIECAGQGASSVASLDPTKAELRLDAADKYKLKLLAIKQDGTGSQLLVTSYQAGNHQLKAVQLVDDKTSVVIGDLSLNVTSVISPVDPPKEPYGPRGPMGLGLPIWYYGIWLIVILVVLGFIAAKIRRRWKKRKLVAEIQALGNHQDPFPQFTQSLRKLNRENTFLSQSSGEEGVGQKKTFLEDLEKSYRLFVGRSLSVPSLQWGDRNILREIRRDHRQLFDLHGEKIQELLQEFKRARSSFEEGQTALNGKDCVQLLNLSRQSADEIFVHLKKVAR